MPNCQPATQAPIFSRFARWEGWVEGGWDVNWLGVRTRATYYDIMSIPTECRYVHTPPLPFDEEYFEWIDLLEAVVAAKDHFVMIELGAGWGRWTANAAAAVRQFSGIPYRLKAVEAEPTHFSFMKLHLADNGLRSEWTELVQAAVAPVDGIAVFEAGNATAYYGQTTLKVIPRPRTRFGRAKERFWPPSPPEGAGLVPAVSLATLTRDLDRIDLIDADIQGAESDVFEAAAEVLDSKVKRLHVETHNRKVEEELRALFASLRWQNMWDYPSEADAQTAFGPIHFEGGVQTWINPKL